MEEHVIRKAEDGKHRVKIIKDMNPESPREWSNLGTMLCMHGRYNLGDEHHYKADDFSGWDEVEELIWNEHDAAVVLRLDLYDHSGITMMVGPYTGPDAYWDSGQVGFIYVTKEDIRKNWGIKRVTKKYLEKAEEILRGEVETYDQYLRGDVYGFIVETVDGVEIDSCWGFYGDDPEENGMNDYIEERFRHLTKEMVCVY